MNKSFWLAVDGLCAVDTKEFDVPLLTASALETLKDMGCTVTVVDIMERARSCIGVSSYDQSATQKDAPDSVNCRTFISWAYAQAGIGIPCNSMMSFGRTVNIYSLRAGDVILVTDVHAPSGRHVGLASGNGMVIHSQKDVGVVEVRLYDFLLGEKLCKIVRYVEDVNCIATVKCPPGMDVLCSLDLENLVRRSLSLRKPA